MANWKSLVEAKQAELERKRAELTTEDREEIAGRATLLELEEKILEESRERRALELGRRVDEIRERLGPDAFVEGVTIRGREDTFVVGYSADAHKAFVTKLNTPNAKTFNPVAMYVDYAVAVTLAWNDITDFGVNSTNGPALRKFLNENSGIATSITNVATRLAGAHAEERKS